MGPGVGVGTVIDGTVAVKTKNVTYPLTSGSSREPQAGYKRLQDSVHYSTVQTGPSPGREGDRTELWGQNADSGGSLSALLAGCAALGKSPCLSGPQFPSL